MKNFTELIKKTSILVAGLFVSLPVLAESFSYTYEGNEVNYTVLDYYDGTCKTSDASPVHESIQPVSGDLVIPETVYDGDRAFTVVEIGRLSFYNKDHISSVKFPSSIQTVGEEAFANCDNLTSVIFCDSPASIDNRAFKGCSNLTSIDLGNYLTYICYEAFQDCGITSLTIPESLQYLGPAFQYNPMDEVVFNAISCRHNSHWTERAFYGCPIRKVTFGKNVTKIPDALFSSNISIEEVIFNAENCADSEVTDGYVLSGSMKKLTVGDDVKRIPANTFMYSELESITMGSSVSEIAEDAFYNCSKLKSIVIPESVSKIGASAFCKCEFDKVEFNADAISGSEAFSGSTINDLNIGNNVRKIAYATFKDCSIETISIPDNVTEIGKEAFAYCGCKSVKLGNSVSIIGKEAFNCYGEGLETIEVPESVKYIGSNAFKVSRQIILAGTPETIEKDGFYSWGGVQLRHIFMPDPNEWCSANIGEMRLTYDNLFVNDTKVENLCLKPVNGIVTKYCFNLLVELD